MDNTNQDLYGILLNEQLDKALAQIGADKLDPKHQDMIKLDLIAQLEQRLRVSSITQLNSEALAAYGELVKSGEVTPQEQMAFFAKHIPNYQEFLNNVLNATIAEFVALAKP